MITRLDDYLVHQTPYPVAQPGPSDRNFYDRHWMNGFDAEGGYLFEIGFGLYPNRRVMDGHFSVAMGDHQWAFHGSRRAPKERQETVVGPLEIRVIEPLRRLQVVLAPNEQGIECDLRFTAHSAPHQEPENRMHDDGHLIMHNTRFTQMGRWEGHFTIDGRRFEVRQAHGTRDRSWGIRPVGEPQGGAPGLMNQEPGVYWVWSPIHFGDVATMFGTFEDREGRPTQVSADLLPLYDDPAAIPAQGEPGRVAMRNIRHAIAWHAGTRWAAGMTLSMEDGQGRGYEISMEPLLRFQMLGIGYTHATWGHGCWQGELVTEREEWDLRRVDPLAMEFIHTHQMVRARMGDREGLGTLETLVFGRHAPSGFKDFFDGAP